jgi:hypothetical protein
MAKLKIARMRNLISYEEASVALQQHCDDAAIDDGSPGVETLLAESICTVGWHEVLETARSAAERMMLGES